MMVYHEENRLSPPSYPLIDRYGRTHTSLRISVTDRCNIRCTYCMPELDPVFFSRSELLTFEEITRISTLLVDHCGVEDIRITGGEPLVRKDLHVLIERLSAIRKLKDLSLTTNGLLLKNHAKNLMEAGLKRINISLDTLSEEVFKSLTRRTGLKNTLEGIESAIETGFKNIKLNALAIRGITEKEICGLVEYASSNGLVIRFIEYMPLDSDRNWKRGDVLNGDDLLKILAHHFGDIREIPRPDASQPAEDFLVGDHKVGIIRSVTKPFCGQCNRMRITADGAIRNCLFSNKEVSFKTHMREGATDDELLELFATCISAKERSHGISNEAFRPPDRPMYAIGG